MIRCIFCDDEFTNVEGLRTHSRDCEKHPAVIEAARLKRRTASEERMALDLRVAQAEVKWAWSEHKKVEDEAERLMERGENRAS